MANSLWVDTVRSGPLASRPTVPDVPQNTFVFWYDETNNALTLWLEGSWVNINSLITPPGPTKFTTVAFTALPAEPDDGDAYVVSDLADNTVGATAAGSGALYGLVVSMDGIWVVGGAAAPEVI